MIDRCGGQQAPLANLIVGRDRNAGRFAVKLAAFDGTTDDKVVPAPAMIRAVAVRRKRAPEVRRGECRHAVLDAEFDGRFVKLSDGFVDFRHQYAVVLEEIVVIVEPAERDKKHLPL